jgi:hypothetical protein
VSTQDIFDKNSKKKFRPEFMSKKEYVKHVIAAMKTDAAFVFDADSASFTLGDVQEEEEEEEDGDVQEEEEEEDEEEKEGSEDSSEDDDEDDDSED